MTTHTASDYAGELSRLLASESAVLERCWQTRIAFHPAAVRFDRPVATLPVSLTGERCALQCAHCNGVYLKHMHSLEYACAHPAASALISGGCDPDGCVPVTDAQLERIQTLRARRQRLNWHVGLQDAHAFERLKPYVDLVSFDIVGDRDTAREVYGLDVPLADYMRTFDLLCAHVPVVAHITIGLRGGKLSGELAALEALAIRQVEHLVLLVLIPTPGTAYAACAPPALADVLQIFSSARLLLPRTRLYLGCMRPRGSYRQACDALALRTGINVIVNPLRSTVELAAQLDLQITYGEECCALN